MSDSLSGEEGLNDLPTKRTKVEADMSASDVALFLGEQGIPERYCAVFEGN